MAHPTLEDVAARAGVSRALVSLVMRGSPKVGRERREAVLEAARELGYRPNAMARGLAAGRTGIVGVLLADLHEPVSAAIHDGLAEEAARRDVRLLLTTGRGRPALERTALEDLLDLRLDGVVLAYPRITAAEIGRAAAGSPVTVVGRALRSAGVDCVTGDDAAAVDRAIAHLTSLGHSRIACLDLGSRPSPLRRTCAAVLGRTAVLTDPDEPWRAPEPPTAVLALGDATGAAALTALLRAGRNVPGDVSLIVHGDPPGARSAPVTTIAPPPRELGRLAMAALLDRIRDGAPAKARRLTVPPLLTERGTTGPVRR
ncbi:LacI family DNA-binding transcriptional regulator [Spirillospora sp. NPDC048819]|uniref:LacI family DNA-binding transcriptional regulator n=1 Tax=Spirillospora sp. NPDC048819 TaxID=3155268 RepID=UPI0033F63D8C